MHENRGKKGKDHETIDKEPWKHQGNSWKRDANNRHQHNNIYKQWKQIIFFSPHLFLRRNGVLPSRLGWGAGGVGSFSGLVVRENAVQGRGIPVWEGGAEGELQEGPLGCKPEERRPSAEVRSDGCLLQHGGGPAGAGLRQAA